MLRNQDDDDDHNDHDLIMYTSKNIFFSFKLIIIQEVPVFLIDV